MVPLAYEVTSSLVYLELAVSSGFFSLTYLPLYISLYHFRQLK